MSQKSFNVFLVIALALFVFTVIFHNPGVQAQTEPPLTAEVSTTGMKYYLLSEAFGPMEEWTEDQRQTAQDLVDCEQEWWDLSTPEQQDTPALRVILLCWEKVN